MTSFSVDLDVFQGPLDLLLHLIKKHELDIFDIPIRFITERFLEAISDRERPDLKVGGEFLVMAATLAQIKSKSLLPRPEPSELADDDGDPRSELVQQLVEYQRYRELAAVLEARRQLDQTVFTRNAQPPKGRRNRSQTDPLELHKLVEAFATVRKRVGFRQRLRVSIPRRSLSDEIERLVSLIRSQIDRPKMFLELVELAPDGTPTLTSLVGTFLALLELARRGNLRLWVEGDSILALWCDSTERKNGDPA